MIGSKPSYPRWEAFLELEEYKDPQDTLLNPPTSFHHENQHPLLRLKLVSLGAPHDRLSPLSDLRTNLPKPPQRILPPRRAHAGEGRSLLHLSYRTIPDETHRLVDRLFL